MNRTLCAVALCLLAFAPALGQQKEPPAPTIKRRAELVLVPAVVTLDGKAVTGLTAKDFVLLHNGQPEKVEVFEEVDATPAKVQRASLPPRTVQNFAATGSHQDIVILVLDYLNSSWLARARILSYFRDMVRQFTDARSPVSIFLLSKDGLMKMYSFAGDTEKLIKAVERWQSGLPAVADNNGNWSSPFVPIGDAQTDIALHQLGLYRDSFADVTLRKGEMTVDALEQIAEAYRGVPGRKKLIWMSTGFPLATEDVFSDVDSTRLRTEMKLQDKQERAWRSFSNANISVYPIDANGVVNPGWDGDYSPQNSDKKVPFMRPTSIAVPTNSASLVAVAEKTGGRSCTEAPQQCVGQALADGTHYYILGFYLHGDSKPGWHKLKVTVNQPAAGVRARDGFLIGSDPKKPLAPEGDEVMTALASPLDYTSVPLQLTWSVLSPQGKDTLVELALFSPPGGIAVSPEDSAINVDYLAFIRLVGKTEGRTIPATLTNKLNPAQQESFATGGFRFRRQIPLAPARYEVRVLLRDNVARKIGTVSTLIDLSPAPSKTSPAPKR